jgi:ligand-binding SRPBCC domain-containing protein
MSHIKLVTAIHAPVGRCFDLTSSIDFHIKTGVSTHERAIAGKTTGLIGSNEVVTFSARHLGFTRQLTSKITEYEYTRYFTDEMQKGDFKSLKHRHTFTEKDGVTFMEDDLQYEVPFGFIGKIFDKLVLNRHMYNFLRERNDMLKKALESEEWKELVN